MDQYPAPGVGRRGIVVGDHHNGLSGPGVDVRQKGHDLLAGLGIELARGPAGQDQVGGVGKRPVQGPPLLPGGRALGGAGAGRVAVSRREDADPRVRLAAVTALGEIRIVDALDQLVEVLFSEDEEEIRAWAAWSLGEIGDVRAIGPLQEACVQCPPKVREKALDSLEEVFGMGRDHQRAGGGGDP